jgi:cell division protein FtsI (penicillin-binding protein 3)
MIRTLRQRSQHKQWAGLNTEIAPDELLHVEGAQKQALEVGRNRLVLTGIIFVLAFSVIGLRLGELTLSRSGGEERLARDVGSSQLETGRADILDRNGIVLATTLPTVSLYANPNHVLNPGEAAGQLANLLTDLSVAEIEERLASDKHFVWLKRDLSPRDQYQVNRLGIPGLYFQEEQRRSYPQGRLAAHTVGFADVDNNGLAGIELSLDEALRGSADPLYLSLDIRIQHILFDELANAMKEFQAIGASGLVMDADNGEIVAMASLPSFDPHHPGGASREARFNRATLGTYEMGSVFKIFTTAMVLDRGLLTLRDGYDTSDPIRVSRFVIRDFKPKKRWLSIPEIFIYSSNIGTVHMAMAAGTDVQKDFLASLGLLGRGSIELDEVGGPLVPSPWREINTMTIAYGHGMAVNAVQLASAVSAVVNDGRLVPATLLRREPGDLAQGRQVMKPATSAAMRRLMRLVVTHGTGRNADAEGYLVGGKTGTADKQRGRGYARDARIASFVAAFPMDRPRYVVFAMLDEPKGTKATYGYATGGWVAAPAVRKIVQRVGPLMGVEPDFENFEMELENEMLLQVKAETKGKRLASN